MKNGVTNGKNDSSINRNMRCIEISENGHFDENDNWINRNMRCIEMCFFLDCFHNFRLINRNMRCIEIFKIDVTHSK